MRLGENGCPRLLLRLRHLSDETDERGGENGDEPQRLVDGADAAADQHA